MATDRPGLLSKMAMFVRNPTKDWSDLGKPEQQDEAGLDKASLKAMIERKRQNDFVRKREFDHLRKLRRRDPGAGASLVRPSFFQSSLSTDQDGRAQTLKKIDEIEAQMSRQWWKGKQEGSTKAGELMTHSPETASPALTQPDVAITEQPHLGSAGVPLTKDPNSTFEPTEKNRLPSDTLPSTTADFEATQPASSALIQSIQGKPGSTGAITVQPVDKVEDGPALQIDEVTTDPELEEAAIRFANGDILGSQVGLVNALRTDVSVPESAASWLAALLDLYRATNDKTGFNKAVTEFGQYFLNGKQPIWESIPNLLGPDEAISIAKVHESEPSSEPLPLWSSPEELTIPEMETLRNALASNPQPWFIDWAKLIRIAPDVMPLVGGLFESLAAEAVNIRFSGTEQLLNVLAGLTPAGLRGVEQQWWFARLNALRVVQMQDDFELAALDYCVTYEVSPPPWSEAKCNFSMMSLPGNTVRQELGSTQSTGGELVGQILGDAGPALDAILENFQSGKTISISCRRLVRVDFSAAGSILNWVALRQADGCQVRFFDAHRLVAAFFNVIGINEHAKVIPRPL